MFFLFANIYAILEMKFHIKKTSVLVQETFLSQNILIRKVILIFFLAQLRHAYNARRESLESGLQRQRRIVKFVLKSSSTFRYSIRT